jgi:hypothetical protein
MGINFAADDLNDVVRSAHLDRPFDDSFGSRDEVVRGGDQVVNLDKANTD